MLFRIVIKKCFRFLFSLLKILRHSDSNAKHGVKYISGIQCDSLMFPLSKSVTVKITVLALLDT